MISSASVLHKKIKEKEIINKLKNNSIDKK